IVPVWLDGQTIREVTVGYRFHSDLEVAHRPADRCREPDGDEARERNGERERGRRELLRVRRFLVGLPYLLGRSFLQERSRSLNDGIESEHHRLQQLRETICALEPSAPDGIDL